MLRLEKPHPANMLLHPREPVIVEHLIPRSHPRGNTLELGRNLSLVLSIHTRQQGCHLCHGQTIKQQPWLAIEVNG